MLVVIRGAGDLASGIALRLWRSRIRVVMTDVERPTAIRQGHVRKFIKHQSHWHGQRPLMDFVCLIVKLLKRLRVEHTNEKVQRRIVRIRDDAKDGLLAFAQLAKLHIVACCDSLNFWQRKRCKADSGAY